MKDIATLQGEITDKPVSREFKTKTVGGEPGPDVPGWSTVTSLQLMKYGESDPWVSPWPFPLLMQV
jgi:hypothetical protein